MKKKHLLIGAVAVLSMAGSGVSAFAAGNAHSGATVGDCISDGFYGNEPNMADGTPGGPAEQQPGTQAGNVLPSQSPGPKVTDPNTGEVTQGHSVGYWQQQGVNGPQLCRTLTQ